MQSKIRNAFPICDERNCLTSFNDAEADIHDPKDGKCFILDRTADLEELSHFNVSNVTLKDIYFLCIDYCTFITSAHKKCDFALFDDRIFCFIEVKDTSTKSSLYKTNATDQLRETIIRFRNEVDFTDYNIEAIISWKYKKTYPAAGTKMQARGLEFEEKYGVRLLEGNQKIFE